MKKISTVFFAATIAVASTAASAWGWGDNSWGNNGFGNGAGDFDGDFGFSMNMSARGHGRGYGNGYNGYNGYAPYGYGYAPYGYGVPVQPAVEVTEEQQKAIADQQAKHIENMQKAQELAQKQAAEFFANQRAPMQDDVQNQRLEEHKARVAEMDARMEERKKAYEARRQEREAAYKARLEKRNPVKVEAEKGA